jgi:hypothetical protein
MKIFINIAKVSLVVLLLIFWVLNFPLSQVQDFLAANFPWPTDRVWKWWALLFEDSLKHAIVCLPVAYLLAVVFGRVAAVSVAITLVVILVLRCALIDLPNPINPPYGPVYILYGITCHALFLVGGILVAQQRFKRRKHNAL